MKKTIKIAMALLLVGTLGTSNAQSFKEKMKAKLAAAQAKMNGENTETKTSKKGKKGGRFKMYDYTDPSGVSGTYYTNERLVTGHNTVGFNFKKEEGGEIVNELEVIFGGKDARGNINKDDFTLYEKYKNKYGFYHFTSGNGVLTEIEKDIYAYSQKGTVKFVFAKDSAVFSDYDVETSQVLYDQKIGKANKDKMAKETAKWKKKPVYANNIRKIVFGTDHRHLLKRGYNDQPPMVDGKGFKTELDMAGNMVYMAFFEFPPSKAYPGQDINVEFEMNGKKTNRVEWRKKSQAWGKMIKRIESKDYQWRQHGPRGLREYIQYYGKWSQDYAFMDLLYQQKNTFLIGKKYTLTVRMYANRDGDNGELLAEGTVKLVYSAKADEVFNGDPSKPDKTPVWEFYEEFLEEQ